MKSKIIILLLISFRLVSWSQESNLTYFYKESGSAVVLNPSLYNDSVKFSFEAPFAAGFTGSVSSTFSYGDITNRDYTKLDFSGFTLGGKERESMQFSITVPVLSFSYNWWRNHIRFSVRERFELDMGGNEDVLAVLNNLNDISLETTVASPEPNGVYMHFREYTFGYARKLLKDKLRVGLHYKLLTGMSVLQSNSFGLRLETGPLVEYIDMQTHGSLYYSGLLSISGADYNDLEVQLNAMDGDYYTQFKNFGHAFDIGAEYEWEKFKFSASAIDLGGIYWKTGGRTSIDFDLYWDGLEQVDGMDEVDEWVNDWETKIDELSGDRTELEDSIANLLKVSNVDTAFYTPLLPKIFVGAEYKLNDWFDVSALYRGDFTRTKYYSSFFFNVKAKARNNLSLMPSFYIRESVGVGAGLAFFYRYKSARLFMATDDLTGFLSPADMRYINGRIGLSFTLDKPVPPPPTKWIYYY